MATNPEISVITAVYNGERHLEECLESIFNQTFTDFELVVVDDGSTDSTPRLLEGWQKRDARLRVLTNQKNQGRPQARNRAVTASRGKYIANLDADDASMPQRLALQYQFLQAHPQIQVLGADIRIHGTDRILTHPRTNAEIRADLFFDSSLFHSTVMMRKSILAATNSWYDVTLPLSQDYGLWASLMFNPQAEFANLPEPLSVYRLQENPRPGYAEKQFGYANEVRMRILQHIGLRLDMHAMRCHLALLYRDAAATGVSPADCAAWGKKLAAANSKNPLAPPEALDRQITERLETIFARNITSRNEAGD